MSERLWLPQAERMRARGMTFAQIAQHVPASPPTISTYVRRNLRHLSNHALADLRRVACSPDDAARVVAEAQQARWRRYRDQRELERRQRRERRHWLSSQRRHRWRKRSSLHFSLDYVPEESFTRHELISRGLAEDPFQIVSKQLDIAPILGDLDFEDVSRLNEWELERLRERLVEAGVDLARVRQEDREAVRPPEPKAKRHPRSRQSRKEVLAALGADGDETDFKRSQRRSRAYKEMKRSAPEHFTLLRSAA